MFRCHFKSMLLFFSLFSLAHTSTVAINFIRFLYTHQRRIEVDRRHEHSESRFVSSLNFMDSLFFVEKTAFTSYEMKFMQWVLVETIVLME